MDKYQPWWGVFSDLDSIYDYIKALSSKQIKSKKIHELYISWVFAKYLESVNKKLYLVGIPTYDKLENHSLFQVLESGKIIDNENFDTLLAEKSKVINGEKSHYKIQIKRYLEKEKPSTSSLTDYIKNILCKYGKDNNLNIIFDIQSKFKLNLIKLINITSNINIEIGSVFIYGLIGKSPKLQPFIKPIYPDHVNKIWVLDHFVPK